MRGDHIGLRGGKKTRNHSTTDLRAHERRLARFQRGHATRAGDAPRTQTDAEIGRLTEIMTLIAGNGYAE